MIEQEIHTGNEAIKEAIIDTRGSAPVRTTILFRRSDLYLLLTVAFLLVVTFSSRSFPIYYAHLRPYEMKQSGPWRGKSRVRDFVGNYGLETRAGGVGVQKTLNLPQGNYEFVPIYTCSEYSKAHENQFTIRIGGKTENILDKSGNARHFWLRARGASNGGPLNFEFTINKISTADLNLEQIVIYRLPPLGLQGWLRASGFLCLILAVIQFFIVLCRFLKYRLNHVVPTSGQTFPFLDGVRGLAVMLVVLLHSWNFIGSYQDPVNTWGKLQQVSGNGMLGVNMFFVISAFTLFMGLYKRSAAGKPMQVDRYFQNRLLRIIPAYFLVVLTCLFARNFILEWKPAMDFRSILSTFSLVQVFVPAWRGAIPNHSVWWSISTEMQFYFLLPILVLTMKSWPKSTIGVSLALMIAGNIFLGDKNWYMFTAFNHLDSFALGAFAAYCYQTPSQKTNLNKYNAEWAIFLSPLLLLLYSMRPQSYTMPFLIIPGRIVHDILFSLLVACILYNGLKSDGLINRIFSGPVTTLIGMIAYGIYLIHVPILYIFQKYLNGWATGCGFIDYGLLLSATMLLTFVLAFLMYKFFEYPIMQWGRQRAKDGTKKMILVFGCLLLVLGLGTLISKIWYP